MRTTTSDRLNKTLSNNSFSKHRIAIKAFVGTAKSMTGLLGALILIATAGSADGGVVSHWKFDESSPSPTAADSTSGHTGTLTNMDPLTDWVAGKVNGALDFDGSNDFVHVDNGDTEPDFDFGSGDFSVATWVNKRAATSGFSNLWGMAKWNTGASPGSNEWSLALTTGGSNDRPSFALEVGSTAFSVNSPDNLSLNAWHHLAATREGTVLSMYVDGVLKGTTGSVIGSVNNVGRNLRIAGSDIAGTLRPNAQFDDSAILNDALSGTEVFSIFNLVNSTLNYDIGQAQLLFDLFGNGGTTTVDGQEWFARSGLGGTPGVVVEMGGEFFLTLDAFGNGVSTETPPVPEPSTFLLLGLGALGLVRHTRRRRRRA